MARPSTSGVPWPSATSLPAEAVPRTSERGRSSGTHSHYTSNGTVIHAIPEEDTDIQTTSEDGSRVPFPGNARLPRTARSEPLNFVTPIPADINTVVWPRNSAGPYAVHDSSHAGPGHTDGAMFTPWVGSSAGARAWNASDKTEAGVPTKTEIWIATRLRRWLIGISCFLYLAAAVLLIVAQTGSTNKGKTSTSIYLFRFDLSGLFDDSIVPGTNTTDPAWSHALTKSLGLRNYYQSGLWGYCEGDDTSAFSSCSKPQAFYWFNPVGIIFSELLNSSTVPLPIRVQTVLDIIRYVSQVMFGSYLVGTIVSGLLVLLSPLVMLSRLWSIPIGLLAATAAFSLFIGSALSTAIALAYRLAGTAINELNIYITVGTTMLALVWTASGLTFVSLVLHAILGICGPSVRDLKTSRRAFIRFPPLDMMTLPCEERHELKNAPGAGQGFKERLQEKGGAVAAALKPWFSPLAMHPLITRERVVPATPPPVSQPPTVQQQHPSPFGNEPPVWGVDT